MNQGRREFVRFVKSLEAKENPRKELDFSGLPLGTMIRCTCSRIVESIMLKLRLKQRKSK